MLELSATRTPTEPATPGNGGLRFEHVSKTFPDGTEALIDVSLTVPEGEMVAIVGPSGCGKSTLLRLASKLAAASTGTIDVGPGNLGYVFQDPTLLPWRTVRRNVELFAELAGVPTGERARLASDAIELTGLRGFEGHRPRAAVGRHADARLARPSAHPSAAHLPLRRAVRSARRDHPRAPQR